MQRRVAWVYAALLACGLSAPVASAPAFSQARALLRAEARPTRRAGRAETVPGAGRHPRGWIRPEPVTPGTDDPVTSPRTRWWRDARFGMFIHWGIYTVAAGFYQGKP